MTGYLTPTDVRRLLQEHGLAPRRSAGQNFVTDPNTVRKIVRDAGVGPQDTIVEIGPGLGSLTIGLAEVARQVVAVEVDAGLVRALARTVGDRSNVTIVHADALETDLGELVPDRRARLVANLPYNVATPLVMQVLAGDRIDELFVMVQREVGQRWGARPGSEAYGAVSVKIALAADVELIAEVPRRVFHPVPKVASVTVRLTRAGSLTREERAVIGEIVDAAFASRRKTMRNNLRRIHPDIESRLQAVGIDPGARAEQLTPPQHVRVAVALDAVSEDVVSRLRPRDAGHGSV